MDIQPQYLAYTYTPLKDDHFRVIEITSLEPTISVELTDCPDTTPPEYFAVSYAWGLEQNTETILCSGKLFNVTPHLKEGLRCMCAKSGSRRFWVDAICINQANNREKEVQVAKMHHIYRQSKGVYVWLGKEENDSDAAISAIKEVQDKSRDEKDIRDEKDVMEIISTLKSEQPRLFDVSAFKPLANLSRRTWFRRLWIAQEYFYGQSVLFFCGMSVLDDSKFTDVLYRFSISSFGSQKPPGFDEELELFEGFRTLADLKEVKDSHLKGDKLSFFDFVLLGRKRFAKEPVDRLYAVFGMAESSDTIYRDEIQIDYSEETRRNYWKVYSNFGKIALTHEPNLRLLSIVSSVERPEPLPSWCPNLNSTSVTTELDGYAAGWTFKEHGKGHNDSEPGPPSRCFRHSNFKGKDENHVLACALTNTISIWGAALGRISALAQPCEWNFDFFPSMKPSSMKPFASDLLEWIASNEKFCRERIADTATEDFIWENIFVGANDRNRGDKHPELVRELEPKEESDAYLFMIRALGRIADNDGADQDPEILEYFKLISMWVISAAQIWHNRILFATDNGKFGYASTDITEGDTVCMLYGGRTMYVLRERGTEPMGYQFVSDSYVYDCMDGQVFDLMDDGVVKEELFAIS
jgi:hypothetical protein